MHEKRPLMTGKNQKTNSKTPAEQQLFRIQPVATNVSLMETEAVAFFFPASGPIANPITSQTMQDMEIPVRYSVGTHRLGWSPPSYPIRVPNHCVDSSKASSNSFLIQSLTLQSITRCVPLDELKLLTRCGRLTFKYHNSPDCISIRSPWSQNSTSGEVSIGTCKYFPVLPD